MHISAKNIQRCHLIISTSSIFIYSFTWLLWFARSSLKSVSSNHSIIELIYHDFKCKLCLLTVLFSWYPLNMTIICHANERQQSILWLSTWYVWLEDKKHHNGTNWQQNQHQFNSSANKILSLSALAEKFWRSKSLAPSALYSVIHNIYVTLLIIYKFAIENIEIYQVLKTHPLHPTFLSRSLNIKKWSFLNRVRMKYRNFMSVCEQVAL